MVLSTDSTAADTTTAVLLVRMQLHSVRLMIRERG